MQDARYRMQDKGVGRRAKGKEMDSGCRRRKQSKCGQDLQDTLDVTARVDRGAKHAKKRVNRNCISAHWR